MSVLSPARLDALKNVAQGGGILCFETPSDKRIAYDLTDKGMLAYNGRGCVGSELVFNITVTGIKYLVDGPLKGICLSCQVEPSKQNHTLCNRCATTRAVKAINFRL